MWPAKITTAAVDPYRGASALPDAVPVRDAFHVVRLAFAVDDIRRRIQRDHTGHRDSPGVRRSPVPGGKAPRRPAGPGPGGL